MTKLNFESGKEMLDYICEGHDVYCPSEGIYVFLYNQKGSICYYDWIYLEKAIELSSLNLGEDYWGGFLGRGGWICDDESCLNFCNQYYDLDWYDTDELDEEWKEMDYDYERINKSIRSCL